MGMVKRSPSPPEACRSQLLPDWWVQQPSAGEGGSPALWGRCALMAIGLHALLLGVGGQQGSPDSCFPEGDCAQRTVVAFDPTGRARPQLGPACHCPLKAVCPLCWRWHSPLGSWREWAEGQEATGAVGQPL